MCGLAGYVRHPQARERGLANEVFSHLLLAAMSRGRQATGMSVTCQGATKIMKSAIPAHQFVANENYLKALAELDPLTTILMGHTRNATLPNGHVDEAAHPFRYGKIVGAHNGIILNYDSIGKELGMKFDVDSQAAFALLDRMKKAPEALAKLEGYFALTWVKGRNLFMCRSSNAPTACAYIGEMQTMFWASEIRKLENVLKDAGIDRDAHIFETKDEILYRYDPSLFSKQSANAEKITCDLKGAKAGWAYKKYGAVTSGKATAPTRIGFPTIAEQNDLWEGVTATPRPKAGQESLAQLRYELDSMNTLVKAMAKYIKKLAGQQETNNVDIDYLMQRMDEAEDAMILHGLMERVGGAQSEDEDDNDDEDPFMPLDVTCARCGEIEGMFGKGKLLDYKDGELVHEGCLFVPEDVS